MYRIFCRRQPVEKILHACKSTVGIGLSMKNSIFSSKNQEKNHLLENRQNCRFYSNRTGAGAAHKDFPQDKSKNPLKTFIVDKIRLGGPISVAEYMQMCVGSQGTGYYSKTAGDIFGTRGDFITSPEFTQLIGELLGIWVVNEFMKLSHSGDWQFVELGPGSGQLMNDMLEVFRKFRFTDKEMNMSIHLVETSPRLIEEQATVLCGNHEFDDGDVTTSTNLHKNSKFGPEIFWHKKIEDLPKKFSFVVAHEFFDALPVHKFRKNAETGQWREILVGLDPTTGENLCFQEARGVTVAQKLYLTKEIEESTKLADLELSPQSAYVCNFLADLIMESGGACLIVDYGSHGDEKTNGDTLRAYRNHKHIDPLLKPGRCDITCDVDFAQMLKSAAQRVALFGPLAQRDFLINMGLNVRFEKLLKSAKTDAERDYLQKSYDLLTKSTEMGDRFKTVAFFPKIIEQLLKVSPPSGFCPLK